MLKSLKTTTALVASLNLIVPLPALAQSADAQNRAVEACSADITSAECLTATQEAVNAGVDPAELQAQIQGDAAADATAEGSGTTEAPVEEAPTAEAPMEEAPTAEAPAEDAPAAETPAEQAPAVETPVEEAPAEVSEVPSEEELQQQLEGTAGSEAEAGTEAAVETAPAEAEVDAEAEAETEAEAMAPADEAPVVEAPTEDTPAADETDDTMPSAEDLERQLGEAEAETQTGTETETQTGETEAETQTGETEAETQTGAEADAEAEADATADVEPVTNIDSDTTAETSTVEPQEQPMTESEQAAVEGTAPSADAGAEDAEAVETETTTVTDTRSFSEDFDGSINTQPADANATAQTEADNDDEDGISGLTDLEKALALGAGALGVGLLLRGNQQVVASSNDRVVVSGSDGGYELIKDDNALLLQPGAQVQNQTFDDGSSRSTVTYEDGTQIVTIRDNQMRVVRRVRISPNGEQVVLIDDLNENIQPVNVQQLQQTTQQSRTVDLADEAALRQALAVERDFDRAYSLSQVRNIAEVRQQVPAVDLEAITFETGSAAIRPEQADELRGLGQYIRDSIAEDPRAIFLVEGHTDTVGNAAYNLALSDRRAESVALALSEYFDVPPSNLVVQGYGERFLKVAQEGDIRENRRATVRNVTPLLQVAAAN